MTAKLSRQKIIEAFTLIEVMVSITIFMLVMLGVIACWKCIINGKIIAEDAAGAAQRARVGIKTVEDALSTAEISLPNLSFYYFLTDTSGKFASLSVASRLPESFPGSHLFGDLVMRRVTFEVKEENGTNNLVMSQAPLLQALNDQNTPYEITLARDVNVFMLEFWSTPDNDWVVSFDPTNAFPPMIRITLGVGHTQAQPDVPYDLIVRTVAMPVVAHQ
ncbi:MAG TPA: prepilin-type N-terminal cleavage/methylation domain-containing protein [Candidatus Saccharimonadales bacterium]|nr:prepilin-type N-terminal cleavage/methylation domain-containing protein [Candidatus Saccharimonadales bacterium]